MGIKNLPDLPRKPTLENMSLNTQFVHALVHASEKVWPHNISTYEQHCSCLVNYQLPSLFMQE